MKKFFKNIFAGFCLATATTLATPALADFDVDIIGQVKAVTPSSITVDNMGTPVTVMVTPMTDIEAEYKTGPFDYDRRIPLSDIKVGEWVKIDAIPQGMPPNTKYVAEDIEVRR